MCWAGPQALSPPSRAHSSPSRARPRWGLAMGLGLASDIRSPSPGFDILQSGMQIHNWKGKILFCFKKSMKWNEDKIGVTCTSSTSSVDPVTISFDLMESYSLARKPTAINMNMKNRIVYLGQIHRTWYLQKLWFSEPRVSNRKPVAGDYVFARCIPNSELQ